jgi:hypothetical protein
VASAANAVKGLAWMAGGASRAAFNVAWAADQVSAAGAARAVCARTRLGAHALAHWRPFFSFRTLPT